jgi:ligand-binding sensor domain-containing protein
LKQIRKIILVFLLSVLTHANLFSQEPSIKTYNIAKGLPSNECYRVIQDQKGYIWIASDGGLSRYNGYTFQNFTIKDGLPDNVIIHLLEDSKGRIWIIGLNSRVAYFENEAFCPAKELNFFLQQHTKKAQILSASINAADELELGFDTFYSYLITYSVIEKKIVEEKKIEPNCYYIKTAGLNNIAYGFNNGTYKGNIQVILEQENAKKIVINISLAHRPIIARYLKLDENLFLLSMDNTVFMIKGQNFCELLKLNTNILSLYKDHANRIWVLSQNDGAYIFNQSTIAQEQPRHFFHDYSLSSIIEDNEYNYWISSLNEGVYQLPDFDIIHYKIKGQDRNSKMNVVAKYNSTIYTGGHSDKIYGIDKESGLVKRFDLPNKNTEVIDMLVEKKSLVIAGLSSYIIDSSTYGYNIREIRPINVDAGTLYASYLDVGRINQNDVLCGYSKVCSRIDMRTAKTTGFGLPLPPSLINNMYSDTINKRIYLACLDGLYYTPDTFHSYKKIQDNLVATRINHILKKGNLFILSTKEKGLVFWDEKKAWSISTKEGLLSNECRKAMLDKQGNIWVTTNKGISKIEMTTDGKFEINNLTANEGLLNGDVNNFNIIDNEVWIPNESGLTKFNADIPVKNTILPPIYITTIAVDDSLYTLNSFSEISYQHNYIKFNYNGLSYKSNGELLYEYRLTGLDSSWKKTKSTQVQFTRLGAGEYVFEVRAIKNNHLKSAQAATFKFIIYPPWYKTWWFLSLSILTTASVMYLFFWIRFKRLKTREEEKTRLVTLVTETEIKALRAQTNPHFIFNALNSIRLFVLKNKSDQAQFYLMRFARLMRDVLENSEHDVINLDKEFSVLETYMELELLRFGGKYKFEIDIPEDVLNANIQIPPLLLQPVIENAIWHGLMPLEDREGFLLLKASKNANRVTITVEDNGIGRKRSAEIKMGLESHKTSKGIFMTKNRIDLYNSKHAEKIRIVTTDLIDDNHNPIGTRVEIIIKNINQ